MGRGGEPIGDICGLDGVPETNHSGDGGPAMLTIPAVSSTIAVTGTIISVGSARIRVAELIAGEDGGRAEGMGQDPHVSKCVRVACRVDCQSSAITFGIMVGNERIG